MVGSQAFASRQLAPSFGMVRVGDYKNVRVYADNQLIVRTDSTGRVIVPRLRPFEANKLNIELADLPLDAQISGGEQTVRPFNRHGVNVEFAAKPARAAIIRILLEDGSPLAAGSTVQLDDATDQVVSAPGGEVDLTGLSEWNTAIVSWSGGQCQLQFRFSETSDPQPRLGDIRCRSMGP